MMKNIAGLLLMTLATLSNFCFAQISQYAHSPVIVGQQDIHLIQGQSATVKPDKLIIGDVDTSDYSGYKITLTAGNNYTIKQNEVIPNANFTGILRVPCTVYDGKLLSNTYPLAIMVFAKNSLSSFATVKYYVASDGNDKHNGSIASPFKTIEKGLAAIRLLKAKTGLPNGGIELIIREGTYTITKTILLDEALSGNETYPVVVKAYDKEPVFFEGGLNIPYNAFKPLTDKAIRQRIIDKNVVDKIRVVNLWSLGFRDLGEMVRRGYGISRENSMPEAVFTVNGQAQILSSYPNNSYSNMISKVLDDKLQFITKDDHIRLWKNKQDIWLDGSICKPWEWSMNEMQSIDDATLTITLKYPEYSEITTKNNPIYHFKNVLEEIDMPGEYYIDRTNGNLYYYPTQDFKPGARIAITGLKETMVAFAPGAHDIWLQGINLENSRSNGIALNGSRNRISHCAISGFSQVGAMVNGSYNELTDCHITYTGMEGVLLNDRNRNDKLLEPTCNVLKRCEIDNFSNWFRAYTPGIKVSNVGTGITHCKLHDAPHFAIGYSGNDHVLEYTEVYRSPGEFSDMLSVYFNTGNNPQHRGTVIRRNYFHDVNTKWKQGAGVYLDNETYGVAVLENYFYNSGGEESGWSVMVHGGGDNIVRNNIFIDCRYPFLVSTRLNGYAKDKFEGRLVSWGKLFREEYPLLDTVHIAHLKRYPELIHFFDDKQQSPAAFDYTFHLQKNDKGEVTNYWDRRTPSTNVFENNLVYNSQPNYFRMKEAIDGVTENRKFYTVNSFPAEGGKLKDILIHSNNFLADTDPGFVNFKGKNFSLKNNADILKQIPALGKIPFNEIGIH